jgi:isopenicillin N synthase-like dioxygenase
MVTSGISHIGRLLHYFPFDVKENVQDDWCGWHNDHGALTALTSSMYIDKNGN